MRFMGLRARNLEQAVTAAETQSRLILVIMIAAGVTASMAATFAPFMVGALVEFGGLTTGRAGGIVSAEMAGAALGALASFYGVNKYDRRGIIVAGLSIFMIGNIVAASVDGFLPLMAVRTVCGFASAAVVATACACIAMSPEAERAFGYYFLTMIGTGALGAIAMPQIVALGGAKSIFLTYAIVALVMALVSLKLPRLKIAEARGRKEIPSALAAEPLHALGAVLLWFVAFGAIWTFVERVGAVVQLSANDIGFAIAISQGGGAVGALIASILGLRMGAVKPIVVAATAYFAATISIPFVTSLQSYVLMVFMLSFGFSMGNPYLSGLLARLDTSGRLTSLGTLMQAGGLAIGPGVGALVISGADITNIIWLGAGAAVVSAGLAVRVSYIGYRKQSSLLAKNANI